MEQVVRGANFISVEDPSYVGDYVPDFKALVGPMLYDTYDEYSTLVRNTKLVADMKKAAEAKGIKILALDYVFRLQKRNHQQDHHQAGRSQGRQASYSGVEAVHRLAERHGCNRDAATVG